MEQSDRCGKDEQGPTFEKDKELAWPGLSIAFSIGPAGEPMVDLTRVDRQCGKGTCSGEQCHEPQHGARRDEIARKSGCDRRDDIACMVEGFIAADAPSKAGPDDSN